MSTPPQGWLELVYAGPIWAPKKNTPEIVMFSKPCYFCHVMSDSLQQDSVVSLIEFTSSAARSTIQDILERLAATSPFALRQLAPRGSDCWMAEFAPRDYEMDLRFAKATELHLQIARRFDVRAATYATQALQLKGQSWPAMQ